MPDPIDIPPGGEASLANSMSFLNAPGVNQSQLNYLRKFMIGSGSVLMRQDPQPEQLSQFSLLPLLMHMTSMMQQPNGMQALTIRQTTPA